MSSNDQHAHLNDAPHSLQRRQLLTAALSLGVAPWLQFTCATPAGAVAPVAGDSAPRQQSAGQRRKLGPIEVFPVGLRFDAEEPGQALLVEEGRGERVGGRETPHGITRSSWRAPQVEHGAAVVTFGTPAHRFLKSLKKRRMGCPR